MALFKILFAIACIILSNLCRAYTPLTDQATSTTTVFSNGDRASVSCVSYSCCKVEVFVFGNTFQLMEDDLHFVVIPDSISLLPLDKTDREFVVILNSVCPKEVYDNSPKSKCSAGIRFANGKIEEIEKYQTTTESSRM
jgi:hypothetical protein